MRTLRLLPLLLLALLLPAATATSATVDLRYRFVEQRHEDLEFVEATLSTDDGTASDLELRSAQDAFAVRDARSAIVPGENCAALPDGWVECRSPRPDLELGIHLDLGDLDDTLHTTGGAEETELSVSGEEGADRLVVDAAVKTSLWGGQGDDLLQGGSAHDLLLGGSGADLLRGGPGDDVLNGHAEGGQGEAPDLADDLDGGPGRGDLVSYSGAPEPVTVDLLSGTGIFGGVRDTIRDVEGIGGGEQPSRLLGSDGPDSIEGWIAGDRLAGRGGDDRLRGRGKGTTIAGGDGGDHVVFGYGGVSVDAGGGDDTVRGHDPLSAVVCGAGTDTVRWSRGLYASLPWSRLDCERLEAPYAILRMLRAQPSRLAFRVRATVARRRLCAVRAFVRAGQQHHPPGRALARTTLRLSDPHARTLDLVARGPLPRTVTVELHPQPCDRRGVPRTAERLRITRIPLQLRAGR